MEVGEYVRTKNGDIGKVFKIEVAGQGTRYMGERLEETIYCIKNNDNTENYRYKQTAIVKHSKNIIDLIEVGDYVNGELVDETSNGTLGIIPIDEFIPIDKAKIKSVVTHEQFKSMEYKVGGEDEQSR